MARAVVITGASRGIGRATALLLAERGRSLALVGRDSEALTTTASDCRRLGVEVRVASADVSDPGQVDHAARAILDGKPPRALINNAGIVERSRLEDLSLESFERQMRTNLLGPMWLSKALLPAMRSAGSGTILNVGSISGTLGTARQTVYNASKWALVGFTKSLAEELKGSGLMAVTVLPGAVDTDMLKGSGYAPSMSAADVAKALAHYALDAGTAHNGASIDLFGG